MSSANETVQPARLRTRSVRFKPVLDDRIEQLRKAENRSYSQQVVTLVEEALQAREVRRRKCDAA